MPKRRSKPSPSHGAASTRSRSELFVHRTRSGLGRPDPSPPPLRHLSATASTLPNHGGGGNAVKDLRLRRVFSPASASIEEEASHDRTDKIGSRGDQMVEVEAEAEGAKEDGNGGVDEISKLDSIDAPKSGLSTPPVCAVAVDCGMKSKDLKDDAKLDPIDPAKNTESTPPECVVAVDLGMKNTDQLMEDSQNDIKYGVKFDPFNPSKRKLGLAPCSRSKLVRNPSLFSYRRMLPFLMDLDKEENPPCLNNNNPVKVETVLEEKQLSPPGNLPSEQPLQCSCSEESLNEELCKSSDFVDNPSMNSCDGESVEVPKIESEASLVDPIIEAPLLHKPVYSPLAIAEALSVEEMAGSVPSTLIVLKEDEVVCKNTVLAMDIDRKLIDTSKSEIVHSSERRLLSPKKGILKRQTRGCKGICMCLDCVSFRIHADRAFEFSRKQMQEADETIGGLVKELASLRNLVEKSIMPLVGSGTCGILQFSQDLIKGACRRASRAEETANSRCRQMFNDLNAHCRIPGPRVRFAVCIEERKTPSPETSNSKSPEKFTFYGSS